MTSESWLGLAILVVSGGTSWLFSLHGRLSRHEAACEQRQRNLDERHSAISRVLDTINNKLDRLMEHNN